MERNTVTQLINLQPGDRFYFIDDKIKVAHQVVKRNTNNITVLNAVTCDKHGADDFDKLADIADRLRVPKYSYSKEVVFLRHTTEQKPKFARSFNDRTTLNTTHF